MPSTTTSTATLRAMLPDLALQADKEELLRRLRPLQLDIDPCDPDFRMCIRLRNGYALMFTAGDMSLPQHDSWVRVLPVGVLPTTDLLELASQQARGGIAHQTIEVAVYTAFVRLLHDDPALDVPTTHFFVESPSPFVLVDDALIWCRKATGLPLQWQHLDREAE